MAIYKSEFEEWLRHPITRAFMSFTKEQIEQAKDTLSTEAGTNPLADRDLVGGIAALKDVLEWQPEDLIEEKHEIH